MTDRENCLRAIRRQRPEWVPQEYKCIKLVNPACLLDRVDDGVDWFGVRWRETVPEVGERLLPDITKWREIIYFPIWRRWTGRAVPGGNLTDTIGKKSCCGFHNDPVPLSDCTLLWALRMRF